MAKSTWTARIGKTALTLSLLAVVLAVGGSTLARYDIIPKITGFMGTALSLPLAALALSLGLIALIIGVVKRSGPKRPALIGFALSAVLLGVIAIQVVPNLGAPPMHDITTDLDNPPEFAELSLRADNLVPFASIDEWRAAHRANYGDIQPIYVKADTAQVLDKAQDLARGRGWKVVSLNPQMGRMEATAYESWLRFNDDVVLRVTPQENGTSRVDMRSVSRVGVGDMGVNARRVREFLKALQAPL